MKAHAAIMAPTVRIVAISSAPTVGPCQRPVRPMAARLQRSDAQLKVFKRSGNALQRCRAEPDRSSGVGPSAEPGATSTATSTTSDGEDNGAVLSRAEVQKLAELRRTRAGGPGGPTQSNPVLGALEEAQLIAWPTPKKAFFDTLLVLGIVTATGVLLFGLNVLLAETAELWYSSR